MTFLLLESGVAQATPLASIQGGNAYGVRGANQATERPITPELDCLATAIAYEAGYEPVDGRRAVADVILNRMRSGVHPATVCGVVYEGSSRRTGCQFTFTCDGSLRRALPGRIMSEARQIADDALSGASTSLVGGALNYHADYVSPYWAASMYRVVKIGRHIFYRPARITTLAASRQAVVAYPSHVGSAAALPAKVAAFAPWGISLSQ